MFLVFLFILFLCLIRSLGMKGYNFGDNKMDVRWAPDNGYLKADFPGLVPPALTSCSRFYLSYSRHGDQYCPLEIFTQNDKRRPIFFLRCKSSGSCHNEVHSSIFNLEKMLGLEKSNYPKTNLIRKWTSFCVSLDFVNNDMKYFFNGKKFNTTIFEEKRKNLPIYSMNNRFPEGYFEGTLL